MQISAILTLKRFIQEYLKMSNGFFICTRGKSILGAKLGVDGSLRALVMLKSLFLQNLGKSHWGSQSITVICRILMHVAKHEN